MTCVEARSQKREDKEDKEVENVEEESLFGCAEWGWRGA